MIKAVLFDLGDTLIVEEAVEGRHLWEVTLQKIPHVEEVLRELRQRYKLGVVTNTVTSREQHVRMALKRIGLEQYFDVILTSVDVGYNKPDEKIFLKALEALNVQPEEAVMGRQPRKHGHRWSQQDWHENNPIQMERTLS